MLGIVGLVGGLGSCCCCLFLVLAVCAPIAWYLGRQELRAIREGRAPSAGEGAAQAGMVCGIIGTVLLALYLLGMLAYVGLVGVAASMEGLKKGGFPLPR